jgi:hypothetical protein
MSPRLAHGVFAIGLAVQYWLLWPAIAAPADFDAVHLYQPLARSLLEHGLRFFAMEPTLQAPPFSYVWFAIFGAEDLALVKTANVLLSGVTLFAVFRSAWLLHSPAAACVAVALFVASPLLRPHLGSAMSEPPYLLLSAIWFWGHLEWTMRGRGTGLAAGAGALALAALTRATMFYWIVAMALASAFKAWRARPDERRSARAALAAYLVALALPLAISAKNWIVFDFPFYTTGAGNALYLGNNPLTGGYDPHYVGLGYDVGAIVREALPLTLRSERLLRGAAKAIFEDKGVAFLAGMHARKLAAFVFVTGAQPDAIEYRAWRIALVLLSMVWFAAGGNVAGRLLLGAVMAYQLAIHIPVLYTHRYSVGAIDLWLVIGAALGTMTLLATRSVPRMAAVAVAIVVAIAVGNAAFSRGPPMPDVFAVARQQAWKSPGRPIALSSANPRVDLDVAPTPAISPYFNHVVVVEAPEGDARCETLAISYRDANSREFSRAVEWPVAVHGGSHVYQAGETALGLTSAGTLRLEGRCPAGAVMPITSVAIYAALGVIEYRARALGEPAQWPAGR